MKEAGCFVLCFWGNRMSLWELWVAAVEMGAKLSVPVFSFWLCGTEEGKEQHPVHCCSAKTLRGRRVGCSSPSPGYDPQERCSNQPRYEYRIRKYARTISDAVEFFCSLYFFVRPQCCPFIPTCPCPTSQQTLDQSVAAGMSSALLTSLLFSLPVSSFLAHCCWVL